MNDDWYYAENDVVHGPLGLTELRATLSLLPHANQILVWRHGFQDWTRAADVVELTPAFRPPPLHTTNTLDLDSDKRDEVQQATIQLPNGDPKLTGIGGWLALLAIGQALGPLRYLVSLIQYYSSLEWRLIQEFPIAFSGEALMNAALGSLYLYTAILFFRTSRSFRKFFVYEVIATIFVLPVSAIWVGIVISVQTGQSIGSIMKNAFEPQEVRQAAIATLVGFVWILYLYRSKRVANTFIK